MTRIPTTPPTLRTTLIALGLAVAVALPVLAQPERPAIGGKDLDDLMVALEREYRLWTVYDRAVRDLGAGEPFLTARRERAERLRRLTDLYQAYGLAVPGNPWEGRLAPFAERSAACLAGFRAELAIGDLYDELSERAGREELAALYRASNEAPPAWLEELRDCALEGEV
ncbi:MAG TPA: hypothetical protein VF100_07120 [Thermoanaerobaculia bacterium]